MNLYYLKQKKYPKRKFESYIYGLVDYFYVYSFIIKSILQKKEIYNKKDCFY